MGNYILSFTVYTLAMSGLIFFALFVYKKVMQGSIGTKNSKILSVEETMSISPRKTLMIVKAGAERFLIASDIDKTTLISKLDNTETIEKQISPERIEHFKNIESQPIDLSIDIPAMNLAPEAVELPDISDKEITKPKKQKSTKAKEPIHLEVVKEDKPKSKGRKAVKSVSIDVVDIQNHGFSTMKEMAQKVNEM